MAVPWPPPPDRESLRDLLREADVEDFIAAHGAPADEYDTEADVLLSALTGLTTADLTTATLAPILNGIWQTHFNLQGDELEFRQPALHSLADQIVHFFGPEAEPQVRS